MKGPSHIILILLTCIDDNVEGAFSTYNLLFYGSE